MANNKITEIENLKKDNNLSKRAFSPLLEEILYDQIKVLDHGFVRVIDYMGNDNAVTQAARVSYGKGTKTIQSDKALINYLMRNAHTSPFEMCEIKFHIKVPIFIARQWIRHRTANINEYSGRYSVMSNEFYIPEKNQIMEQSKDNKQGRGNLLESDLTEKVLKDIKNISDQAFEMYNKLINLEENKANTKNQEEQAKKVGLARELARIILPLSSYTEFYWKIDLHNLLHFLFLRTHSHAQYEIREYANVMIDIVKKWTPITYDAFVNYKQKSVRISKEGHKVINDALKNKNINKKDYSLSNREWEELEEQFNLLFKQIN